MTRQQKSPVESNEKKKSQTEKEILEKEQRMLTFIKLVSIVKDSKDKEKVDEAFSEIVEMMKQKIKQLSYKIKIPGCGIDDLYDEALFALRYKAIQDYDQKRSTRQEISPFDNFAVLCIRRHLSTKLKASFQSKQRVLNHSISLDQDRSSSDTSNDSVVLSDIITKNNGTILSDLNKKEDFRILENSLWQRMSSLERNVYLLYRDNLSYEEIAKRIYNKKGITKSDTKSIDNSLSRIKIKAKWIYQQYFKE
jgi:RNA polymerase sporulation-specific sigma factor